MNKKGETLIEVITALTALVIAGLASVTIIISVMHSSSISKEYLIAQNLAREGIEGVIAIRDTNWLQNPSSKNSCWLALDPDTDPDPVTHECTLDKIVNTSTGYILKIDFTSGKITLVSKASQLALSSVNEAASIGYKMVLGSDGIYRQDGAVGEKSPPPSPNFYRMITFSMIDANTYRATATVQWLNKSNVQSYVLTSIITNYAK